MDKSIQQAVKILSDRADALEIEGKYSAVVFCCHAIRHIVRPERDVWPKMRTGTKRDPATRGPWQRKWGDA